MSELMAADAAFAKYGYAPDVDGVWMLKRGDHFDTVKSERWLPVPGGFLCFKPARLGFGEVPWGWPVAPIISEDDVSEDDVSEDDVQPARAILDVKDRQPVFVEVAAGPLIGSPIPTSLLGLVEVPFPLAADYVGVSGLHPAAHPEAFRWVWTEAEVAFMYQYAEEGWVKVQDYDPQGVPNGSHMERAPAST